MAASSTKLSAASAPKASAVGEKHLSGTGSSSKHVKSRRGLLATLDKHQIDGPLVLMLAILGTYALFPTSFAQKFLFFQEYDRRTETIEKSWEDTYFVVFWVMAFTFLRATVMTYGLIPLARRLGASTERSVQRFAEQGWIFIYYSGSWALGLYCLQQTPTWNNWALWFHQDQFFDGYPLTALPVITKYYYFLQFSFWIQQVFVLCIEEPRKDFVAIAAHHFVTVSLIVFSLVLNVTTVGTAVFVSMDLADILLSLGKCLKYIEMPDSICDTVFAGFMLVWIYTRHYLYGHIIYAWITHAYDYISPTAYYTVIAFKLALQGLMFFWLWSILRIVYKMFATKGGVVDDRSDDEEERASAAKNKAKKGKNIN